MTLPGQARAVVIGGGIIGCSLAYHLTKLGWKDVVLLERKQLTSGTTWHAAGLVRAMLYSANLTRLARHSIELYGRLEAETGQATGFKQNGSISLALNAERWDELRRGASMAGAFDVPAEPISAKEAQARWPLLNVDDVVGAIFFPKDGQTNPADTTQALARGARMRGATILEGVAVTGITVRGGRVRGVTTDRGTIESDVVVNCAGMWARAVGRMAGANLPLHACEHFYVVTEPVEGAHGKLPVMRVMDECAYYKEDAGKILLGAFEPKAKPWGMDGIPDDFAFTELPEDFDHFQPILEAAMRRVPALQTVGIRKFFNGPESFTPDQRYLLGETPDVRGLFVAAGFNSIGIQSAGGAGMALAEWIVGGEPPFDLWDVDISRMMPHQGRKTYLVDRVSEALGLLYAMHWPYRQFETARGVRRSPFHERLAGLGAVHGEVAGWERPNWYAGAGQKPRYRYSFGRQNWFANCAAECAAIRGAVGLLDQTSFAKFLVHGADAEACLQRVSANDVGVVGRAAYTQWLNERGGIVADLTVTRLDETRFLVVTAAATAIHNLTWLKRNQAEGARVAIDDVTGSYAVLGVMGPRSRELLGRVTAADLGNTAFPFGAMRTIEIGAAQVMAIRISYVGELGWELYIPTEFAGGVLDAVLDAGADLGVRPVGMHAMDALRIEKAYRHWGHDISPDDTPLEAGLGFACAFGKSVPFIGRDALLRQKEAGVAKRMVQFALEDPEPLLYHNEPIHRDGVRVGLTTSANYGHTLGRAIAMGYVRNGGDPVTPDWVGAGRYEIEVGLRRYPARASLTPMHDPKSLRVRA